MPAVGRARRAAPRIGIVVSRFNEDVTRRLLAGAGWMETRSERFVSAEKFPGVWAEFGKGDDICRLTVVEGSGATHVDYTLARVNPGS